MIIDRAIRVIRYLEINERGSICASSTHTGVSARPDGTPRDEEDYFQELVAAAALKNHTIIRLCNHEDCSVPKHLSEVEPDGRGGIRAKPGAPADAAEGVDLWDEATHKRAFVLAKDERQPNLEVRIRLEPGEFTQADLDTQEFYINPAGKFSKRPRRA